jgi:hypothetical protein
LRDDSNSKTRVRFVYVLREVLHGDFLSEIKYLISISKSYSKKGYGYEWTWETIQHYT